MRSGKQINYKKEKVLEAISGSYGIISKIAENLECSWWTAKRYCEKWEATRQALEEENESAVDFSESMLMKKIKDGDSQMIRFHLATKGKRRGYTEKQEVEHTGNNDKPLIQEHHLKFGESLKSMSEEDRKLLRDIFARNNGN